MRFRSYDQTADGEVILEDLFLLQRHRTVIEEGVNLVVDAETAVIEVRRPDARKVVIADEGLGMVELAGADIELHTRASSAL